MKLKSTRGKIIKLIVKEFVKENSFTNFSDVLKNNLQDKLDNNFCFECEVTKLDFINSCLVGQILFENNEENHTLEFVIKIKKT